jgi:hypothetical protein
LANRYIPLSPTRDGGKSLIDRGVDQIMEIRQMGNSTAAAVRDEKEKPEYSFQIEAYPGGRVGGFVINSLCVIGLIVSTFGLLFLYK